ncbi:hypothetical protein GF325_14815 [Candidatus Bathyarchaeota archaeon]|nr:hypothetical protein [Candidatus Bathyarchaeota archaeon]
MPSTVIDKGTGKNREPLLFRKGIFGLSRTGSTLLLDLFTVVTLDFYIRLMGLGPVLAGLGVMLGKFSIAASGFFMGYISDRFPENRLGRRKPFLIMGSPVLGISFMFLLLPFVFFSIPAPALLNQAQGMLFSWLTFWSIMFNFAYGFLVTPYQSMMPETFEEKDRIGASLSENLCSFIGTMGGIAITLDLATQLEDWSNNQAVPSLFTTTIIIIGILTIIFYLPAIIFLPIRDDFITKDKDQKLLHVIVSDTKRVLGNNNYVNFIIFTSITEAGFIIAFSALEGYIDTVLDVSDDSIILIAGVLLAVALLSTIAWAITGKRKSIHLALTIGLYIMVMFVFLTPFIGRSGSSDPWIQTLFLSGILCGMICEFMYQYVILANIVEEDERRTGESLSGTYHGVLNLPENIFQGLGAFILGLLLSLPKQDRFGTYTFSIGYFWWGPVAAVFFIVGIIMFRKIKVDLKEVIEINKRQDTTHFLQDLKAWVRRIAAKKASIAGGEIEDPAAAAAEAAVDDAGEASSSGNAPGKKP